MNGAGALIALAAGGTGGHLFPAEALAQELKRRGWSILLVTDARGEKYADSFPADDRILISAASPSIGGAAAKAAAVVSLFGGLMTAVNEFRRRRVAAAVGFGGYPSFPAMQAAALLGVPYGVHEQNGVLGRANRVVAGGAKFVAHGFPLLEKTPRKAEKLRIEIGNPVRDAVAEAAQTNYPPIDDRQVLNILVFGGSQGASLFSRIAPDAIAALPQALKSRLRVTQQVRDAEAPAVRKIYEAAGIEATLAPFFSDLPAKIAASHLVIARAGASTVTELSTIGRPSILAPLAIAMDDHQTGNARALSEANAAILIPESEFTIDALTTRLHDLLTDAGLLQRMAAAAKNRVKSGAASTLADLVEEMAAKRLKAAA